ncbi:MAG: cation:proton antiporter [Bacteroidales bacterium]|nr:cation:proton antiporter [Bacteroidales bacterium]
MFKAFIISLPISDPTWIFFLVLSIILFAPLLFDKLRIPSIIGLIIAGIIVGEHGLNLLAEDSSFKLFGKVGLYYIMFLAGLEMNMGDFRKNQTKTFTHGILAFIIPMILGLITNITLLQYGILTSILLASMYASHTLIAYPIALRYGLSRQRSVGIAVGATAITDTLTLLVLAIVGGMFKGDISGHFWIWMIIKTIVLFFSIIFFFPRIARAFFKRYEDNVTQFIFVLAMVFLGAGLMEFIGMEGILGAFLAGLVLNRYIPQVSPLMAHLEFVGNALFIPYFLISVGMMVNIKILFSGINTLKVSAVMITVALSSKWLASYATQKIFKMKRIERDLIYGLSNAQAAATLAAVLVGYNIILPNHTHLLNDEILNGTILLILVTCIFSSFTTEYAARKMALSDVKINNEDKLPDRGPCIISYSNPENVSMLTQIAIMMHHEHKQNTFLGLNVIADSPNVARHKAIGRKCLTQAAKIASSANVTLTPIERVSTNIITGIIHTMKEYDASELMLGLHRKMNITDSFFGAIGDTLLKGTHRQIMIVKCLIPPNTFRRIVVAVPPKAEYEVGFYKWARHLCRITSMLGCRLHFYAHPHTLKYLEGFVAHKFDNINAEYSELDKWEDLLLLTGEVNYDCLLVIVSARPGFISYDSSFENLPHQIARYFNNNSLMMIYPEQNGDPLETPPSSFLASNHPERTKKVNTRLYNQIIKWINNQLKKV